MLSLFDLHAFPTVLFRSVGFWWAFVQLVSPDTDITPLFFCLYSVRYYVHIAYMVRAPTGSASATVNCWYLRGYAEVLILAVAFAAVVHRVGFSWPA